MFQRATGALLSAYLLLAFGGLFFVTTPSPVLRQVTVYSATVLIWGLFYLLGGAISSLSLLLRRWVTNTAPFWYFEIAGLCLIIAANFVYAYALFDTARQFGEFNVFALSLIILAFSSGLIARVVETLRLIRTLKFFSYETGGANSE